MTFITYGRLKFVRLIINKTSNPILLILNRKLAYHYFRYLAKIYNIQAHIYLLFILAYCSITNTQSIEMILE